MRNWSIQKKLYGGVGALLGLLILAGGLALYALQSIQTNLEETAGPISDRITRAAEMVQITADAWGASQGAILSAVSQDGSTARQNRDEVLRILEKSARAAAELRPLLATEESRQQLALAEAGLKSWEKLSMEVGKRLEAGELEQALALNREKIKPLMTQAYLAAESVLQVNAGLMQQQKLDGARQFQMLRGLMLGVILVAVAAGVVILWQVRGLVELLRNSVAALARSGGRVATTAGQISSTSQSLSQGSSEQAASLEEVSASMEEMTAVTKRNAENATEAASMMRETVEKVNRSTEALREMVASMSAMKASSEKVGQINKSIEAIAFQTNILALNAAVEAARAGEAGQGFAVVADEVRSLAQRSAVAAKDTATLIDEAIVNSNQSATTLNRVATAIRDIDETAGQLRILMEQVTEASRQQGQGISQVAIAVTQVSQVTQQSASSAEQSASAAVELSSQSKVLAGLVHELELMVEGGARR
jgi:methyl-accepting chemotaxis protein